MPMFKQLQQPAGLQTLATKILTKWIKLQGLNQFQRNYRLFSHQIENLQNYFKNTPGLILNNLFEVLMDESTNMKIRYVLINQDVDSFTTFTTPEYEIFPNERMIEVLFNENLSTITLSESRIEVHNDILCSKYHLLTGLKNLKLSEFENEPDDVASNDDSMTSMVIKFISNLHWLKYLTLTSCNDIIIRCIAENCQEFEQLDLYESIYNISEEAINMLTQLPKLNTIHIFEPEIVGVRSYPSQEKKTSILKHISLKEQIKIKSFVIWDHTTLDDLLLVSEKFADIESVTFFGRRHKFKSNLPLKIFDNLENLVTLSVLLKSYYEDEVEDLIRPFGRTVRTLNLDRVLNIDVQALKHIGKMFPYLESLTIIASDLIMNDLKAICSEIENPLFKHLKILSLNNDVFIFNIGDSETFHDELGRSASHLISLFLLKNCPNIEVIDLKDTRLRTDFMMEVLNENPMKYLRELYISDYLENEAIHRIIENGLTPLIMVYIPLSVEQLSLDGTW